MAGPIVSVDFRGPDWNSADPLPSCSLDGATAAAHSGGGRLYQDNTDGLGVPGGEHDEFDSGELLEITNVADYYDTHDMISGVLITDLFDSPAGGTGEDGWVEVYLADGALLDIFYFAQLNDIVNGELSVSLTSTLSLA